MHKSGLSSTFDLIRWSCALLVVTHHARQLVFAGYERLQAPGLIEKVFYGITALGHERVVLFLFVSGFLVGGLPLARWGEKPFSLLDYGIRRFSRIYVAFIPALVLTWALDQAGLLFLSESPFYAQVAGATNSWFHFPAVEATSLTVATFLSNLVMLYGVTAERFGSNGPLWSLANEWWYYCLFGASVACAHRKAIVQLLGVAALLAIFSMLPAGTLILGIPWLAGMATCLLIHRGVPTLTIPAALLIFAATLIITHPLHRPSAVAPHAFAWRALLGDAVLSLSIALLVLSIAARRVTALPGARVHRVLAEFSYSVFLTHYPVCVFVAALMQKAMGATLQTAPSVGVIAIYIGCLFTSYAVAVLFYLAFERRTDAMRSLINSPVKSLRLKVRAAMTAG
ncbi:acyltransferase [Methylobacterium sp. V23]|uniref:acyltransferase family protein n=1 Tax=Methylobacterium sp. V23 TaxID=2044878 RepID=UPI0015E18973|nr:acyltransferase [Methylobacterium sp. V23]